MEATLFRSRGSSIRLSIRGFGKRCGGSNRYSCQTKWTFQCRYFTACNEFGDVTGESFAVRLILLAKQKVRLINPIDDAIFGQFGAGEARKRRESIHLVDNLFAGAVRRNLARPADDERGAQRPFHRREV